MDDKRFYLLIGIAILLITVCYVFYCRSSFIPRSTRNMKKVRKDLNQLDKEINPSTKQDVETRHRIVKHTINWPIIGMSEHKRLELSRALDAIEWRPEYQITVDDVYFMAITNLILAIVAGIIAGCFYKPLFIIFPVIGGIIAFNMPATNIKKIVAQDEKQIKWEFPDFFDIVYVQYREHDTNVLMADIVDQYIPVAGDAFKNMLRRFALDLPSGEDYALEQLDKHYINNSIIHRFCSVMRQRLKGEEASYVAMDHFRDTLQADVHDWMFADLEKRKQVAARWTGILTMVILTVVMIVYFVCFFKESTGVGV